MRLPSGPLSVLDSMRVLSTNVRGRPTRMWSSREVAASSTTFMAPTALQYTLAPIAQ